MNDLFKVFTVTEITRAIKDHLESRFTALEVEGEISNFRPSSTGHYYFTLKDQGAMLSAVMFKNRLGTLRFIPSDGKQVRVTGRLSLYEQRGSYQIICESMMQAGQGEILAMLEERKRRLALEGLFDADGKKPLPRFPRKIGVVTSPTGAALKDILQVTRRRSPGMDIVVIPAPVQGADAAARIAAQIRAAETIPGLELLIVGRGGGSLEDLLPFSDEEVVRAVAACPLPIISAVGHEIDSALTDYAADAAAPTPSAAAEMACPPREELARRVDEITRRMQGDIKKRIEKIHLLVNRFQLKEWERLFAPLRQNRIQRVDDAREDLIRGMERLIQSRRHTVEIHHAALKAGSPERVLSRGFALLRREDSGTLIVRAEDAPRGTRFRAQLKSGTLTAAVEENEPQDPR
jgi:exodeoxyribonuclease VII large subunit